MLESLGVERRAEQLVLQPVGEGLLKNQPAERGMSTAGGSGSTGSTRHEMLFRVIAYSVNAQHRPAVGADDKKVRLHAKGRVKTGPTDPFDRRRPPEPRPGPLYRSDPTVPETVVLPPRAALRRLGRPVRARVGGSEGVLTGRGSGRGRQIESSLCTSGIHERRSRHINEGGGRRGRCRCLGSLGSNACAEARRSRWVYADVAAATTKPLGRAHVSQHGPIRDWGWRSGGTA